MLEFKRSIPQPISTEKQRCPRCHERMRLTTIEPEAYGIDRRTFVCATCQYTEILLVKFH
jgi:transposase-like protein